MYGGSGEITDPIRLGVVNDKLYELRSSSDFLLLFTLNNSKHWVSVWPICGVCRLPLQYRQTYSRFRNIGKNRQAERAASHLTKILRRRYSVRKYWCINNYPRIFMNRQPTMPRPYFGLPKPRLMAKLDIYKTKDVIIWQ